MYLKHKVLLAIGPLFKNLNTIALICLLIFVNLGSAGKLPLLKRDTSSGSESGSSGSSSTSGLSTATHQNIEINLGLNHKKYQTEKVPAQSNVVINCNIEHLQGWYKNNENLNVEQKSLTLKSIKKIDSGLYGCKSINDEWLNVTLTVTFVKNHNKTTSGSKKLRFINTSSMHSLMKKTVEDSVKFHCAVEDPAKTLNSKLTWTKNGKPLNRVRPVYFTKTTLQMEELRIDDSGQYTCHICNVNSCINFTTTLDVVAADDTKMDRFIENLVAAPTDSETLKITTNGLNNKTDERNDETNGTKPYFSKPGSMNEIVEKPLGNMVRLACNAKGNPEPLITWTKDNQTIKREMGEPNYRKFALILEDLMPQDSGSYKCMACNLIGCIEHSTKLHVVPRVVSLPFFTHKPENLTLAVGSSGEMKCHYYSTSPSYVKWTKETCANCTKEKILQMNPENVEFLRLKNVTLDDEGWYACSVSNTMGVASRRAYLNVVPELPKHGPNGDPDILNTDKNDNNGITNDDDYDDEDLYLDSERLKTNDDITNKADTKPYFFKLDLMNTLVAKPSGATARLRCNAKGNPEPMITWTRDGQSINRQIGATIYSKFALILEDLAPSDTGTYKCEACNAFDCIEHSTRLYVNAQLAPCQHLMHSPENLTLLVGGSGEMKCTCDSDLHSDFKWFQGTCTNCMEQKILQTDFENPNILRLENVTLNDEGWYTCLQGNNMGTTSARAYLAVVTELPVDPIQLPMHGSKLDRFIDNLVADPDILNNDKNDNYGITNDDDDEDLYLEPEFREPKNRTNLTEPNNYLSEQKQQANIMAIHQNNTSSLENGNGQEEDEDIQIDSNNKSYDEDDETRVILPYFTKPDSMDRLVAKPSGNMVRLACNAKGNPVPTITWTKDNETINRQMGAAKYRKFALILEDLVPSDSGSYKCMVCNEYGCIEHSIRLYVNARVNHPPIMTPLPDNLTLVVGGSGEMKCTYFSDSHSISQWIKGKCDNCTGKKILQTDSENPEILRLDNVTFEDEGWYTCYAANSLGTSAASAYLTVISELPVDRVKLPMRGLPIWLLILIIILASSFIIAVGVMCVIFKKLQIEKQNKKLNLEKVNMVTKKIIIVKPNSYNTNGGGTTESISFPIVKIEKHRSVMLQNSNCEQSFESEYEFPIDEDWEIPRSKLTTGRPLGEGEFGRVMMAEARDLFKPGSKTIVAVKMLKDGHTDQDVSDLVSEMELMKMIGKHINIINLLGCCTQDGPLHVIVEYAPHGNLRDFLKSNRLSHDNSDPSIQKKCFTEKELVSYAYQAARGMEYLASRRCVHRDLAARNVLVGEDSIIKIADFGLARDIHAQDYYRKNSDGRLPIKWMAPESLMYKKYDSKSDVWSYGILLWEIMSLGATPYPYMAKYTKMITTLQSGYRMEKPEYCSMDIYTLMRECWNFRPDQRPDFSEIVKDLDQILSRTSDKEYLDLGLPELETPPSSENESDTDTEEV